jgi:hypothetical protein
MPYCANCKYDYESSMTLCPDCGAALVKGSYQPPVPVDDDTDSVLLLETDNPLQAEFLVGVLEEEDIPYVAKGLGITDIFGGSASAEIKQGAFSSPGPKRIWVNPADYDRAKELLDSLAGGELDEEDVDETGKP